MAACSLGSAPNIKLFSLCSEYKNIRSIGLPLPCKLKCRRRGISGRIPSTRHEPLLASCSASGKETEGEVSLENNMHKGQILPSSLEVQSLLTTICDTTSIAEFELKLAGFRVYVKRDSVEKSLLQPVLTPPQIPSTTNKAPDSKDSAAATSLAISKPKPLSGSTQSIIDTASDEGLVILRSPKVGFFRKSRTIKGKRAPPSCKENQVVKEGQVLCFIEQLGGEIPVESDASGEIIKILRSDGEPVGYGDALIAILPSFPGIKKLQ